MMHGKNWAKTLLVWTYDEHGGYYDHVAPPRRDQARQHRARDRGPHTSRRRTTATDSAFLRSSCRRTPRKNYVSHVVHDHTSILKLIETKWNLPAMTYRDANADNLLDSLDFKSKPAFLKPPKLPKPGLPASVALDPTASTTDACTEGNPGGTIPPPESIVPANAITGLRIGAT